MVVNEIERLNNKHDTSHLFAPPDQPASHYSNQFKTHSLIGDQNLQKGAALIHQYKTQNNFYTPDNTSKQASHHQMLTGKNDTRLSLGASFKNKYSSAGGQNDFNNFQDMAMMAGTLLS